MMGSAMGRRSRVFNEAYDDMRDILAELKPRVDRLAKSIAEKVKKKAKTEKRRKAYSYAARQMIGSYLAKKVYEYL